MDATEELLRESVARLEQSLAAERIRRDDAEALLSAVRCIVAAADLAATDAALLAGLRPLLGYQQAAVLVRPDGAESFAAVVASDAALGGLCLRSGPLLTRVLGGQPAAIFDVRQQAELAALAAAPGVRAALCVSLRTTRRAAVLVATHAEPKFFTPRHVALARGFVLTGGPVLESLTTKEHAQHRRLAEERAAVLERNNELLRDQLATIGAQQRQIQRLSAPVLQVWRGVLVVPVVGDLDEAALAHLTEALLHALTARRARRAIVDLTGLETVDLAVAGRLRALIGAVTLVGARCIITGVRPQIAGALAEAGVASLGGAAFSTLEDGLQAALAAGRR